MGINPGTVVVAVGGNSLIIDKDHISLRDQAIAAEESMMHVAELVESGWKVVITHGNGPQIGFLLRRAELAAGELPTIPLDVLGADTQGATGYLFTKALHEEYGKLGIDREAVAIVTKTSNSAQGGPELVKSERLAARANRVASTHQIAEPRLRDTK